MRNLNERLPISGPLVLTLALAFLLGVSQSAQAIQYYLTDLGTLGGTSSEAHGINNSGQIVGSARNSSGDMHAFLWISGSPMQDLGTLGGYESFAFDISNSGEVVGWFHPVNSWWHAFRWTSGGGMEDLNVGDFREGRANGINNIGQIVGNAWFSGGVGSVSDAFLYSGGGPAQDLGSILGGNAFGQTSDGTRINDSGQIVGWAKTSSGEDHAYLYNGSGYIPLDLGTLGGNESHADGINSSGQVVGEAKTSDGTYHAFLYSGSFPLHDLGTLGGNDSCANGINNSGQIVGEARISSGESHAFLYTGSGPMQDLNNLIVGSSALTVSNAYAINDNGQIAGRGLVGGDYHAFLLTPTPEPSTLVLFGLGAISLLAYAWRRRERTGRAVGQAF
jgi:probable HAF family extracellular repeat protein